MSGLWAVIPAAGRGRRFGSTVPKQYTAIAGVPVMAYTLDALLAHPEVEGVIVALVDDDSHWPGWTTRQGKPVRTCTGGAERADSVLAALRALGDVDEAALVLVHDAARPNLHLDDISHLIAAARAHADGALLAARVHDTLKRESANGICASTEPREALWRALTPQAFMRGRLMRALEAALSKRIPVTDESMAIELDGGRPCLVAGREDNIKITTPADLALAEFLLTQSRQGKPG